MLSSHLTPTKSGRDATVSRITPDGDWLSWLSRVHRTLRRRRMPRMALAGGEVS